MSKPALHEINNALTELEFAYDELEGWPFAQGQLMVVRGALQSLAKTIADLNEPETDALFEAIDKALSNLTHRIE